LPHTENTEDNVGGGLLPMAVGQLWMS